MIKIVFFDFDGVLTLDGSGTDSTCEALSVRKNIPYEDIKTIFRPLIKKLVLSPDSYESILSPLNDALRSDITLSELIEAAQSTRRNPGMYLLVEEIRSIGVKTGIITDNTVERMELLKDAFNLSLFNPVIVSAEIGQGKWQGTRIFESALEKADVKPEEAVFIDNTKDNLSFAAQLRIHTYWHDHQTNNVEDFKNWLNELNKTTQR